MLLILFDYYLYGLLSRPIALLLYQYYVEMCENTVMMNVLHIAALKFCFKTCVAMKFVDDDDDDDLTASRDL